MKKQLELEHYFAALKAKREAFALHFKHFAPQLAPHFNSFNFFRPNENKISEIIAFLLNPAQNHEQRGLFLKFFLESLKLKSLERLDLEKSIGVSCEAVTDRIDTKQRRIDIEINFNGEYGIAIENKPFAVDQKSQLRAYAQQLEIKYRSNWLLIYLNGGEEGPSETSASQDEIARWRENEQFVHIGYSEICFWLARCEMHCQSDRVRYFLRDFKEHCKRVFMDEIDMADANVINSFITENNEQLEMSLSIGKQMVYIKNKLMNLFLAQLKEKFEEFSLDWKVATADGFEFGFGRKKSTTIYFWHNKWKKHCLALEFNSYEGWYWGIAKQYEEVELIPFEKFDDINNDFNRIFKRGSWFSIYALLEEPYNDWDKFDNAWLEINSGGGELLQLVYAKITSLAKAANRIIEEAE